jgi:hypothetical protein
MRVFKATYKNADRALLLKEAKSKGLSISSYLLYCWKKAGEL